MFVCQKCNHNAPKWLGQCPECREWNTFTEHIEIKHNSKTPSSLSRDREAFSATLNVLPLDAVSPQNNSRISTGSLEFDRVLGGGLLPGSVVLLGGEPGIGKSTLLLKTAAHVAKQNWTGITTSQTQAAVASKNRDTTAYQSRFDENTGIPDDVPVLYFCTEESQEQVSQRAKRLGISTSRVLLSQEYRIEHVNHIVHTHKPRCIIIDSIQALRSLELSHTSGKATHICNCAAICCEWSQQHSTIVIIVAHITKEGIIAGPKLIEHMVDTVLMFEKSKYHLRFLYAQKNRHGAVDEVGILHMSEKGLLDITDTKQFFLEERTSVAPPGICVAATYEGSRPFLVEIQSLTVSAHANNRVYSDRIDTRQISRIAAVLEQHLKVPFSHYNLYVNVAGGIRISEPGLELALALSLYSTSTNLALPPKLCAIGELSLPGEVHAVDNFAPRCRQADEYGFTHIIAPKRNVQALQSKLNIQCIGVQTIEEAKTAIQDIINNEMR